MTDAGFRGAQGPNRPRAGRRPGGGGRAWRAAAAVVLVVLGGATASAAVPGEALAIAGLERTSKSTEKDYESKKSVLARCSSEDKQVIGGGGEILDGNQHIARFTELFPVGRGPGGGPAVDYFRASAQAIFDGQYTPWSLTAYAICADKDALDDWKIVSSYVSNDTSRTFVEGSARCPDGTVAYSAGARIDDPYPFFNGRIGLQMIRTSGSLDIGRATARENTPLDTPNPWFLTVYAVCAEAQEGIHVEGAGDADGDQAVVRFCNDPATYVHGAGGGAGGPGITDAGRSWLKEIVPSHALRSVRVEMAGPDAPEGGVIASQTCARGR
jgi:hypothetical protein